MDDIRPAAARRRVPAGFLGMLALLVAAETLLIHRGRGLGSAQGWLWDTSGRAASRRSKDCRLLCLGDSQVLHGMVVGVLEDRVKEPAMNLAFSGGQAPTTYFQLRRVLAAGGKPSAVIVAFNHILLAHGWEENTYRWAEYLTAAECVELAWSLRDPDFFAWVMTGRILPSLRYRPGLRELVLDRLKGMGPSPVDRLPVFRRNVWKNRGTLVFENAPESYVVKDIDGWIRAGFLRDRVADECNLAYLDRFLELASGQGIPVFWVVPPNHPTFEARKEREGINVLYTRLLRHSLARFPNLTVLDARYSGYPRNVFIDESHVHREGAITLTADVAAAIRSRRAGTLNTRYVTLPEFRPVEPGGVPIEDALQTFFVLRDKGRSATK